MGLFTGQIYEGDDIFVEFRPAGFTFNIIWPTIYLFQWAWLIYVLTSLCRRNQFGPLFVNPPVVSPFFLWVYCVAIGVITSWFFLWDRRMIIGAAIIIFIFVVLCVLLLFSIHRSVDKFGIELHQYQKRELWAIRILIQNGIMIFFTWTTIALHLTLTIALSYVGSVPQETSTTIFLAVLGLVIVVYFILENFVWERFLRYTYTFWITAVWALLGIFVENWGLSRNALITLMLLIVAGILGLIKLAWSIMRTKSNHLYRNSESTD